MTAGLARLVPALALAVGLAAAPAAAAGPKDRSGFLDLTGFFQGASVSAGDIVTLLVVREAFTASFEGRRTDGALELKERFRFADGPRLQRWKLREDGPSVTGTVSTERSDGTMAAPVPVSGRRTADTVVLAYRGIAPGGGGLTLAFRHEISRNADGTLANHVTVRKFGLELAVSDVTFAKSPQALREHLSRR